VPAKLDGTRLAFLWYNNVGVHLHFRPRLDFKASFTDPRFSVICAEARQLSSPPDANRSTDQESINSSLGPRLRARRKALGLSRRSLAARAGVSASFLSQVERGLVSPSIQTLIAVSRALEVPIYHFLLESPDPVVRHGVDPFPNTPLCGSSVTKYALLPTRGVTHTHRRKKPGRPFQRHACPSDGDTGNRPGRRP